MYQPETPGRRKANPLLILLGVLIPAGIAGYAATTIGGAGKILHPTAPPQVRISWTQGGEDAVGVFENLTDAPLKDVALECYVNEPNEVRGITTGSERVAYHALFENADKQAALQWNLLHHDIGMGSASRAAPVRETGPERPPLVTIEPHHPVSFFLQRSGTTFPIELRATAQGAELTVEQVPPHY